MVVLLSPRLAVIEISRVASMKRQAPSFPDHLETQHRAEALLLPLGQLVLRMARQASVEHPLDARLLFQPFGQYLSAGTMSLHAQAQGFQPLEKHPGIEWAERRPGGTQEADDFLHLLAAPGNHTAKAAALAVDAWSPSG